MGEPDDPLVVFAGLQWPGAWFVRDAAPSGRLAVLYAVALGARADHDYLGCEHLVAGSVRARGLPELHAPTNDDLRRVAAAAVAASRKLAQVHPDQIDAWFADEAAGDPVGALASIRILPTLSPRAEGALRRARGLAARASAVGGAAAVHVLSGVLADPGIVGPVAEGEGISLDGARQLADRRAAWGPLLDLLEE